MTDVLCDVAQICLFHLHSSLTQLFAPDAVVVVFFVQSIAFALTIKEWSEHVDTSYASDAINFFLTT